MRDIEDYSEKYRKIEFEKYKVLYRRKKIVEVITERHAESILEIGCGMDPLFQYLCNTKFTIVEPSQLFCDNIENLIYRGGVNNVRYKRGFFEDIAPSLSKEYDLIICSSLLHEVESPDRIIKSIADICNSDTLVHINVPNANSLHRLLGKEMGILQDVHEMSENNIEFQQNINFDKSRLEKIVNENGLRIIEFGGYFLKPFSHKQMYRMMQMKVIDEKVLDGLFELGKHMPEICSEIYVNCKINSISAVS